MAESGEGRGMTYIPYETLARVEAQDITEHLPTSLGGLEAEQLLAVQELIADGVAKGLQMGFAMSDFAATDPANAMEIYIAGIEEGKKMQEINNGGSRESQK